jgi:hypothetical protein
VVGQHPVQLLGHGPVERAHPRLHVAERDPGLRRGERARQGRVRVAVDEREAGLELTQDGLQRGEDARSLLGVGPRSSCQLAVRSGNSELVEEHL